MRRNRLEVLDKLKAARTQKAKRTEQYEVQEAAQDVFEDVAEEEYQRRVEANKKNKFIVDDFGMGYDDHGEEEFEDDSDPEELTQSKKPKPEAKSITSFLKPTSTFPGRIKMAPKPKVSQEDSLNLMKSLMNDFTLGEKDEEEDSAEKMELEIPAPIVPVILADKIKKTNELRRLQAETNPPVQAPPASSKTPTPSADEPQINPFNRKRPAPGTDLPPPPTKIEVKEEEELATIAPPDVLKNESTATVAEQKPGEVIPGEEIEGLKMECFHADDVAARTHYEGVSELPVNELGQVMFYWIDAHEDRDVSPGSVLLFGKVWLPAYQKYYSLCVAVKNVPRVLFFQPTSTETEEDFMNTFAEVEQIRKKMGINEIGCKIVFRNYAFELPDVPLDTAKYLKVVYNGRFPPITQPFGATFKHVFGARNSLVENLLVKRRMKGPCWLRLQSPKASSHYSYCKYEVAVEDYKQLLVSKEDVNLPVPPMVVLSLYAQTFRNEKNVTEIAAISGIVNQEIVQEGPTNNYQGNNQSFTIIRKLFTLPGDIDKVTRSQQAEIEQSEKALLNNLMAKIQLIDPDMLIAHDLVSIFLDLLLSRINICGCSGAAKLGRLNRSRLPTGKFKEEYYQGQSWVQRVATCGRLLCDTFLCTKELVKEPTYTLTHLANAHFGREFKEIEKEQLPGMYLTAKDLMALAKHCVAAALIPLDLVMKLSVIPLSKQLTNIAGNLWIRSLQQARAERNEMLLLHEFHKLKYICPDRSSKERGEPGKKKRANAYAGGLVLEPKSGLYDKYVMLLDFNSLYPSIIQEYNICFTTVIRPRTEEPRSETEPRPDNIGQIPDKDTKKGILPEVIKGLVLRRRAAKDSLKKETDPLRREQLEIKQRALKLTANSMYGCLGFKNSRFYAMPIAALITQQGRHTLEKAVTIVREELHLDVIYGDTDSIMISTNMDSLEQAMKLGNDVKQRINKEFRCLEIEIDGVFQSILLYKKKKYAAIKLINGVPTKEVKGLDLVRRDWCSLTKNVSNQVLDVILSGIPREEIVSRLHETLEKFNEMLLANSFPVGAYVITKQLTKAVNQYADIKSQPHVTVAKRMQDQGQQNLLNHFITYIICKGDDPCVGNRAYHLNEVLASNGALVPDLDWYINQQILPPTLRICGVIEGTDNGRLAMIFGQDPSKYQAFDEQHNENEIEIPTQPVISNLPEIIVKCNLGHPNVFVKALTLNPEGIYENGFSCIDKSHQGRIPWRSVHNRISQILRDAIAQFYMGSMKCGDPTCPTRLKQPTLEKCPLRNCGKRLVPEMTAAKLHAIFYHFYEITTLNKLQMDLPSEDKKGAETINRFVKGLLTQSLYEQIKFDQFRVMEVDPGDVVL